MSPSNSSKTKTSSKICDRFRFWLRYRLFCKGVLFTSGLVFSDKLIEYTILALLITYLVEGNMLTSAAIFPMVREGVSALLEIVMTSISKHFGRFLVITVSSVFYVIGLLLLYSGSVIPAILLLAVGQAGVQPIIREFIVDQYIKHDQSNSSKKIIIQNRSHDQANPADIVDQDRSHDQANPADSVDQVGSHDQANPADIVDQDGRHDQANPDDHEKKAITRKNVWCRFIWCFSALAAFLTYYYENSGLTTLKISMVATGSSLILFLCGNWFYHSEGFTDTGRRLKTFLDKMKSRNREQGRDSTSNSKERKEERKKKLKDIGKMSFMWTTFLLFGLVLSAGKTLFPWQGKTMSYSNFLPYFVVFQSLSRKTISYLSDKLLCSNFVPISKKKRVHLARIWIGMLLSIPCFIIAWRVQKISTNVSIFLLVPQFCLLGFMEGLAQDGLDDFMIDLFPKLKMDKVSAINTFVIGLGNFGTILSFFVCMLLFEYSGLDSYFLTLSIVSSLNLCYYSFISIHFYYKSQIPSPETPETVGSDVHPAKKDGRSQSIREDFILNDNPEEEELHEKSDITDPDNIGEAASLHNQRSGSRKGGEAKEQENPLRCLSDVLFECF